MGKRVRRKRVASKKQKSEMVLGFEVDGQSQVRSSFDMCR